MIVVSDSSPLIALSKVGHLDLLQHLFGTVMVPEAVIQELTAGGFSAKQDRLQEVPWLEQRHVGNRNLVDALLSDLDPGESEAIALAMEVGAGLLVLDERRGRQKAYSLGLRFTGSVGVLIAAKKRGMLPHVRPVLHAFREAGFWLADDVIQRALQLAGE